MIFESGTAIIPGHGDVPKWLKGADSKSARRRKACGGSNPSISARKETTFVCQTKVVSFQRNKSLTGFVKYALRVKYCFAM